MIEKQSPGFKAALPQNWDVDRFTRIAITAIKNNPTLQRCDPYSVIGSLMLSAQLGLEPNSPLHEASLIPYKGKAQFQIEYRGLLKLVWNSGLVTFIDYDKICKNDEYTYEKGFNPIFIHKPKFDGNRGEAIAYYAYAELKGGGKVLHIMSKDEVEEHAKKFSKTFSNGPWQTDFDAMAIKTVIKQLADKKLPKKTTDEAIRFASAIDKDERVNNIKPSQMGKEIVLDDIQTEYEYDDEPAEEVDEQPEVEGVKKVDEKEDKPQEETDWENPNSIVEFIQNNLTTTKEINAFKKANKQRLQQFEGDDYKKIQTALEEAENEALKNK
jgi:recombination protein RecT